MKPFYSLLLSSGRKKVSLFFLFLFGAFCVSQGQVYRTQLSGLQESPPNPSPATGTAVVTVSGTTMRVQVDFSGLLGTTVASHIHAPSPLPGQGTAGVATAVPTFPGFPLGVVSGSYDMSFDMTLASSYNPGYLAANGGTPVLAFAALKASLDAGRTYLNVHTTVFPGGEIRGFLRACPVLQVSIPDAFALPQGVLPNTVYPAYAPAASLLLTADVSGGEGPYSYTWSDGSTAASTTVHPAVSTPYSVTVTDPNGCEGMATKTVQVVAVAGGNKGDKIVVCHQGKNSLTIAAPAVAPHLAHGDLLGACSNPALTLRAAAPEALDRLQTSVRPNPSRDFFTLQLNGGAGSGVQISVYDALGRVVEKLSAWPSGQTLQLGRSYLPGIYLVEMVQGAQKQSLRLVKEK